MGREELKSRVTIRKEKRNGDEKRRVADCMNPVQISLLRRK